MSQEFQYCGEFISADGPAVVARAFAQGSWRVALRRSDYDGSLYLRSEGPAEIYLDMDSGQSRRFLFSGGVHGTRQRALSLLHDFSRCMAAVKIVHRIEVYDDIQTLVGYFHCQWPQEQREPTTGDQQL